MPKNDETAVAVVDYRDKTIELPQLDPQEYNLLIRGRTVVQSNPFLKPVVREVTLDHPDDTYPITKRNGVATELGLSKVALDTLADRASILDVPQASGRVDDGRDPGLVTYRSTVAMRMPDGEVVVRTRESTVKLATLEKEIRTQKTARAQEYKWTASKLEAEISKELLLKEKFMERLAESGAHNRAVRAILGLRSKYTPEEIARPFVFIAVVPDMEQPELRARALDQAMSLSSSLFGPSGGQASAAPRQLTAGPAPEEIEAAVAEAEGGELGEDEIEGATFHEDGGGAIENLHTVLPGEKLAAAASTDEPDWVKEAAQAPAKATEPQLITTLRDSAAAAGLKGGMTAPQKKRLGPLFAPIAGTGEFGAVIGAAFGDEFRTAPTASQANAIMVAADSFEGGDEAFLDAWRAAAAAVRGEAAA